MPAVAMKGSGNTMPRLKCVMTNIHPEMLEEMKRIAKQENVSLAGFVRKCVYKEVEARTGVPVELSVDIGRPIENIEPPQFCPKCGAKEDFAGNPALLIQGNKWQCYECKAKGKWR